MPSEQQIADDGATRWRAAARQAAEAVDPVIDRVLREAAAAAWGRGMFRPRWQLVKELDQARWRAFRYVGSVGPDQHRYLELGVVCHLGPRGEIVGLGVDNGVDFLGLHDLTEYTLRRALDHIRRQRTRVQTYPTFRYEHKARQVAPDE